MPSSPVTQADIDKYLPILEAKARAQLRKDTGNMQIHEGVRVHPKYRIPHVDPKTDAQNLELICFAQDWPTHLGGLGAFEHFRLFVKHTWPDIEWNDWMEQQMRSLCDSTYETKRGKVRIRYVSWVGAGAGGKTFAAGLFACAWFMCAPKRTSVTLTSTSKGIISQRVWPVIQKLWWESKRLGHRWEWGHMLESQKMVQSVKGDSKHSICALAVESGELSSSLDRIKGRHTDRMMLIVDEANSTPQAIFECIPNMLTAVEELIVLVIGNAGSRLDPHGLCCEPKGGWKSISIDDTIWPTRGVPKWGIDPGICLHFDGAKSPNVLAGKTIHRHIYTYERWQAVERHGAEYRNTLQHWSQDRGFWPPDGMANTVFSEALVVAHDGTGKFEFLSEATPCASLDTAFGGDDCLLQFGIIGDIRAGRKGLQLTESMLVGFDPESTDPIDYQIARAVIRECEKRGVAPRWFGCDSTGTGRGVAAILRMEWSNNIHSVEFGGAASDLPASLTDNKPGKEAYANRVTELWYSARDMLASDQLKGLSPRAIKEFCSRQYEFINRRYRVESKDDMKKRLGYSPDCFVAGTLISTPAGDVPIENVREGDLVLTPFGTAAVFARHVNVARRLTKLTFSDGKILLGKSKHKVFVQNKGWVSMDAISLTDVIESIGYRPIWQLFQALFTRVENTDFKPQVDTIKTRTGTVLKRDFYTELSGLSTLGIFRKTCVFIIKTVIGGIIESKIWNLFLTLNTPECTRKSAGVALSTRRKLSEIYGKLLSALKLGTVPLKAGSGMRSTARTAGKLESLNNLPALFAAVYSNEKALPGVNTVPRLVPTKEQEKDGQSVLKLAWCVAKNFLRGRISRKGTALVSVQQLPLQNCDVYDLTLTHENAYYANGKLVQNCADSAAILVDVIRRNGVSIGTARRPKHDTSWQSLVKELTATTENSYVEPNRFTAFADVDY